MGTGLNDLPQEVVDAIVDEIGTSTASLGYDDLFALSLAHRVFLSRTQYHIFALSRFILRRSYENVSLLGVLSPGTLALLTDLELDFRITSTNGKLYNRYPGALCDVRSPRQQLPDTLKPLTGLSRLVLRNAVWGERDREHPLLRCLVEDSHPWTTLELYHVVFPRMGDLELVLAHSERLTELKMGEVYVERREGQGSGDGWERVKSLSCGVDYDTYVWGFRPLTIRTLIAAVPPRDSLPRLARLRMYVYDLADARLLKSMRCQPGQIHALEIVPQSYDALQGPLRAMPLHGLISLTIDFGFLSQYSGTVYTREHPDTYMLHFVASLFSQGPSAIQRLTLLFSESYFPPDWFLITPLWESMFSTLCASEELRLLTVDYIIAYGTHPYPVDIEAVAVRCGLLENRRELHVNMPIRPFGEYYDDEYWNDDYSYYCCCCNLWEADEEIQRECLRDDLKGMRAVALGNSYKKERRKQRIEEGGWKQKKTRQGKRRKTRELGDGDFPIF